MGSAAFPAHTEGGVTASNRPPGRYIRRGRKAEQCSTTILSPTRKRGNTPMHAAVTATLPGDDRRPARR